MKLFTIGPVEMYPHTLKRGGEPIPYFRTQEFSDLMIETECLLKRFVGTKETSRTIFLTASGTAAMEAAVMNCIDKDEKVLVISGGSFGKRFDEICRTHALQYDAIELGFGESLTPERLDGYDAKGYSSLLVNLHETSTGQLYDAAMLSSFCKRNRMSFIVDAIGSFLCDPYHMDQFGIDVTIFSSQKGLCLPPGISMVVLNEKILQDKVAHIDPKSIYFNFKTYITDMKRGQTPFTPAVGILIQLHDMLLEIEKEGLENRIKHVRTLCEDFRERIRSLPVSIPEYKLSNAVTPVIFQRDIAMDIFQALKNEYGMVVNPTGGAWKDRILRIAHVGALTVEDNRLLAERLRKFV